MTTTAEITLRPLRDEDEPFLRQLYASTRREELAPLGWPAAEEDAFLRQQFEAQSRHYREHYADASFDAIDVGGRPVGRLLVARWDGETRIVDISLVPEHRRRGIGTRLLRSLLDEAAERGARVSIHVERFNPAMRLYERLGFLPVAERGVYLLMEADPASRPAGRGSDGRDGS
jgi:RimJ/RimL family protein N-acetyltransferase